jgi:hypothetical protein
MKKKFGIVILAMALLALVFCASCDWLDKLLGNIFEFSESYTLSFTLSPSDEVDVEHEFVGTVFTGEIDNLLEEHDISVNRINEIYVIEVVATITSTNTALNFNPAKHFNVYLSSTEHAESKIAWKDPVPETGLREVTLEVSENDLRDFLVDDAFTLRVLGTLDHAVTESVDIAVKVTFEFHVGA